MGVRAAVAPGVEVPCSTAFQHHLRWACRMCQPGASREAVQQQQASAGDHCDLAASGLHAVSRLLGSRLVCKKWHHYRKPAHSSGTLNCSLTRRTCWLGPGCQGSCTQPL